MEDKRSNAYFLVTAIGIGVAVGILFALKPVRELLAQTAQEIQDFAERSKNAISNERESISRAIRVGREAYRFDHPRPNGPSTTQKPPSVSL